MTVAAVLTAAHVLAVFTDGINWDEFALLDRANQSLRLGTVLGGGRPGLATLAVTPFAAGCTNAVDSIVQARLFWLPFLLLSAPAFYLLLRNVLPPSPSRNAAAIFGLALWILAPAVVRNSLQIRADQPAIMFGLFGGLALVASRQRVGWALLSGFLFAVGFLFSQKLLYVAALCGVLAAAQILMDSDWRLRRDFTRVILLASAFVMVTLVYRAIMQRIGPPPAILPVEGGLAAFEFYRRVMGWRNYSALVPTIIPQLVMIGMLGVLTLTRRRGRTGNDSALLAAWSVLGVGLMVLFFHAGRTAYFYMTLGLFPATIGALVYAPVTRLLRARAVRVVAGTVVWASLLLLAFYETAESLVDSQAMQRDSLAFVQASFPPSARGFQAHGAFTCRHDPDPFPVHFGQQVEAQLRGADGGVRMREFQDEFRSRPVVFMLPPYNYYPAEMQRFWRERYVHYAAAVSVPGIQLRADLDSTFVFESVTAAEFIWYPEPASPRVILVNGEILNAHVPMRLSRGMHQIEVPAGVSGRFVMKLPDPPVEDSRMFYPLY